MVGSTILAQEVGVVDGLVLPLELQGEVGEEGSDQLLVWIPSVVEEAEEEEEGHYPAS